MLRPHGLHVRIIVSLAGEHAEIFAFEGREFVFRKFELAFVILDLVGQETPRGIHILSAGPQITLDENLQHRLNDALCDRGLTVVIGDPEQVATLLANRNRIREFLDQRFFLAFRFYLEVEVGHQNDLFKIGAAQQRTLHDVDLLEHVDLDRDALHQRAKHRIHVDINTGLGFILVGKAGNHCPAGTADQPRNCERIPPPAPDRRKISEDLYV